MKKKLLWVFLALALLGAVGAATVLGINGYVVLRTQGQIISVQEAAKLEGVDCILVLGCRVYEDGNLSHMLQDRLRRGLELYNLEAAPKLLMSGDHGQKEYDEVNAMKGFAVENGVPSEDIFMDHAGFSTYESIYRAKEIFGVKKVIIVTQEYHLHRALYIAQQMDLEAYGVASDYRSYAGQILRDIREILARNKDFVNTLFWPAPTWLGEPIPIDGNGNITNDQ